MKHALKHQYPFDPSYGYSEKTLTRVTPGREPDDFSLFWQIKYRQALKISPALSIQDSGKRENHWRIFECYYDSTDDIRIGGWLLLPQDEPVEKALVWIHGYGGVESPDTSWNLKNTALLIPCMRGIGRSGKAPISDDPQWHVLHDIQDRERYILGGCVQDIWCGISAVHSLFPQTRKNTGLMGSSFGGGLSVFASAFDNRIARSHFHVPTFGNPEIRLELPSVGSTHSLQAFRSEHPHLIAATLPYFDASVAAKYLNTPSHWALALFDPFVAPPGQFSIFNACPSQKKLFTLTAGHHVYLGQGKEKRAMRKEVEDYFTDREGAYAS